MVSYRAAQPADAEPLAALALKTFVETFAHLYSAEDLNDFLAEAKTPEALARWIANPAARIMLAEAEGALVGYCLVNLDSKLEYDAQGVRVADLDQLYILSGWQGAGVAAALMDWAEQVVLAEGTQALILSVWQGNHKAQRFYQKHGFYEAGTAYFMVGRQRDDEFIYRKDLAV